MQSTIYNGMPQSKSSSSSDNAMLRSFKAFMMESLSSFMSIVIVDLTNSSVGSKKKPKQERKSFVSDEC